MANLGLSEMNILVGHERSGKLRDALRLLGHEAWSCDLEGVEPGGKFPNYHLFGDVENFLIPPFSFQRWDAAVFFPDCTYLTVSGAWAFGDGPYHQKVKPETLVGVARRDARDKAIIHFKKLFSSDIEKIAAENPAKSFLCKAFRRPDQIIHPNQFGHDASKETGLWLKNLPLLIPTKIIKPRWVNGKPRWANQTDSGQNRLTPSETRAMDRAETYDGVAEAMALQWFGKANP